MSAAAYPLWMLASVAVALERRQIAWVAAAGLIGLGVRAVRARAWRTERGTLALANLLTLLRVGIVVCLPIFLHFLPRSGFVALVIMLLVLDGIDGLVARRRGEVSPFGAALDMETDALTIMVLAILMWEEGLVAAWVLVAGLWRYVYALAVARVPALGEVPGSPWYRRIFCALMICFAGAFAPLPRLAPVLAAIGTTLVSLSFLHSLARSRAFVQATGALRP